MILQCPMCRNIDDGDLEEFTVENLCLHLINQHDYDHNSTNPDNIINRLSAVGSLYVVKEDTAEEIQARHNHRSKLNNSILLR